jgi:glyoxylase-like metal-dependent hydrolase (beta-lactamase superfamily II)
VVVVPVDASARYEIAAVRYGTRLTTKSDVFLHYGLYGEPDEPTRMDYFFWVLLGAGRTILVDCGFNEQSGARRGRTMLCPPVTALHRLGIDPADVTALIVTHAHYDHIGNLDQFPAAEVVMSAAEFEFWTGPLADRPLFATSAEADDIAALQRARADGRLRLLARADSPPLCTPGATSPLGPLAAPAGGLAGRAKPAPPVAHAVTAGVRVLEVGGHTPGQLVVLARTSDGEAVLASDALHYYDEARMDRPFAHVADLPAMYHGFELLRRLAAEPGRYLVAGHDPEVMRRFPALMGPAGRDVAGLAVRIGPPASGQAATWRT